MVLTLGRIPSIVELFIRHEIHRNITQISLTFRTVLFNNLTCVDYYDWFYSDAILLYMLVLPRSFCASMFLFFKDFEFKRSTGKN